ncbi:MAG: hypothetical protein AAF631_08160 [Pseudomonadota bacterium]
MAVLSTDSPADTPGDDPAGAGLRRLRAVWGLLILALAMTGLKALGLLPAWLDRLPEWHETWAAGLDAAFSWVQNDLGLIHVTREIAS